MTTVPVNEKEAEILFNRCLLQSFALGAIQLFAPTTVEEFRSGYDAKLVAGLKGRELFIQFKRPTYSEAYGRFTVKIKHHQHHLLRELYPEKSAYYAVPLFKSKLEFAKAQASLKGSAAKFLRHYICIHVLDLDREVNMLNIDPVEKLTEMPAVRFKTSADIHARKAPEENRVDRAALVRGHRLLAQFKSGQLGAPPAGVAKTVAVRYDGEAGGSSHRKVVAADEPRTGFPEGTILRVKRGRDV